MADKSEQMHIRLPLWMAELLRERAKQQETTPSALVRLAVRKVFFAPPNGNGAHENGSMLHADEVSKR